MSQGIFLGALFGLLLCAALGALTSTFGELGQRFWRVATVVVIGATMAAGLAAMVWAAMGDPANRLSRRGLAVGLCGAAFIVAGASRLWWRTARPGKRPRRPRALASSSGLLGLVAIALTAGGYVAYHKGHGPVALAVAAIGGVGYAILSVVEGRRGQRVLDRMRFRMVDAHHWPLPEPPSEPGADPWEDDRVTGRWGGIRVWVALVTDGALARVELERWPLDVGVHGGDASSDRPTGDAAFDRCIIVDGGDAAWRPVLDAEVRQRLVRLVGERGGVISAGQRILECAVSPSHVGRLPGLLDEMVGLAAALPARSADSCARVLELAASEPVAGVRLAHYRWLEGQGWNTPAVLRAAAADPDPDIAAWARDRLPPEDGVYRDGVGVSLSRRPRDSPAVGSRPHPRAGRLFAGQAAALPEREEGRVDRQLEQERGDQAADHRRGDALHDVGAGAGAPQDRHQADHRGQHGHQLGADALGGALDDRLAQVGRGAQAALLLPAAVRRGSGRAA